MKIFLVVVFCVLFLSSCNSDQDGKGGSAIDRHNERVAQEAVRAIQTPIDLAKEAAEQGNVHNKQMEDQLKTQ